MRLSLVLAGLSWLLNPVGSVPASMTPTDEQQEMIIFGSDRSQPVWFAQTEIIGEITMAQLYTLANAHFNWVRTQDGAETKAGSLLVAALWVPSVHTVFASTIPRGSFSRFMKQSTNIAPVWWSRASHFIGPNNADDAYHAEDGAYFNFEARTRTYRSLEGTNPDNLGNQVYPPGTMVAVWGYYPSDSVDKKRTGRPIDLCDATRTSKPRDPSCQQMAKSLGVGFEIVTDQTPDEQTADDNEDFMMDMSDSDFDQACALLDQPRRIPRGGIKHVRQATACSSRLTEVATYAPTPLTIDLNGLPPPPSTTAPTLTNQQPSTITAGPTLSCELHNQDPDQGILKPYCLCEKSITLSPLPATKAQSDSCAYSTIPGTSASVVATTQTQVWTTNCQACTIVGGIADQETCTSVPGCKPTATPLPTIAAWISNSSTIDIGNAEDGNDGVDLAKEMFNKLKDMCDDTSCKSDLAVMDNVEAILGDGEQPLKPAMYLQDATL
ncbi:hypothetical protein BR93DRAFT_181547 [Coniochaeta sp. PMI_546]|nr:hypothetical protein BR93DRAFT_181547 [Coniochaeta sp. PMI_546]